MNIKKRLTVLSVLMVLILIPGLNVQAATSDTNMTSNIGWKNESGVWYYYKSDNTKAIGWIRPDNNWYYLNEDDGKMKTGWVKDKGNWYYMDESGAMVKGWKQLDGDWYFLTDSGAMATGIQNDGSNLYYFKDSGVMATNSGWNKINDKWYYFDKGGKIHIGWIKNNNKWYYLKTDGSMVTGINKIDGTTYKFTDSGDMETGWITINNNWYYFNNDGSMATGWAYLNGAWYYLDKDTGKMLTNTTKDGYKIGSDGKRYEDSSQNTSGPSGSGSASNQSSTGSSSSSGSTSGQSPSGSSSSGSTPGQSSSGSSSSGNTLSKYYGIDISNYDGYIDFNSVKSSGVQLVYIKATEGTTFIDPYLQANYNGASSAGLKVGFYHFLVGTSAPETQADNFYNSIKDKRNDLKPMLDIEATGFDIMDYALRFIAEFKKVSNMDIGIYTYSSFISNLDGRLSNYPLWEANYNNTPFQNLPTNKIWFSRVGHQYSETGFVNGINHDVDLDEFTQGIFK
ncbi:MULTISPECIES: GH25 family lysozyme [Clostridium]|uniref:GH25 family lysozyme n=1 Tax=Clostridium TaxID=1485 RepID=UPI000B3FE637|nr:MULTISPECIES: GH25 family lysozyme [Clostridium]MZK52772.1 glycoside hydrolase [Clostridium beijerinckii]MZK60873.1 glycoside hydrolase [Clostridium beijerinckii]MZK71079.1 glycoside hydrolase [Clostridium beijerinckii]MZK76437.1 glycoside hydrolase [Clostridium beijerinckii]MZK86140.1 glycoside hydrolase [Clostridium beijerinckii]